MSDEGLIEREVRFAVVIYGGVSLTVYINGIVQEMLNMVRSTAKSGGAGSVTLTPLQRVYRELAHLVGEPSPLTAEANSQASPSHMVGDDGTEAHLLRGSSKAPKRLRPGRAALRAGAVDKIRQLDAGKPITEPAAAEPQIYTRFVVDILSGTSAGGINAIFLAKALANNLSLDSLAKMWITQADMQLLLNDKKVDPRSLLQVPPPSLLNSRWMYLQLLKALDAMNSSDRQTREALVDDLDLFCTTTDLRGLIMGLALTDETVREQRYRNVYHFRRRTMAGAAQGGEQHDFVEGMDPFLAFAARCTSSFPFAFEPMQLGDIPEIVNSTKEFRERYLSPPTPQPVLRTQPPPQAESTPQTQGTDQAQLQAPRPPKTDASEAVSLFGDQVAALKGANRFADICSIYQGTDIEGGFAVRSFGDGGYLDNKPFTYAIQTIKKRHALLPVDRKLIYIEPAPETFKERRKAAASLDYRGGGPKRLQGNYDPPVSAAERPNVLAFLLSVVTPLRLAV